MHDTLSRSTALTVLVVSMTLAGCKGKDKGAAADSAAASSMAMHDSSATGGVTTGALPTPLSDANIAALLDEVNGGDSTLAAAALPKLTNSGVRGFAKMMMGEHHRLHVIGLRLEKVERIAPQLPATDPFNPAVNAEQSALNSMAKGAAYDSTYIAHEVGIHQAVNEWAGKNTPQNAALQRYVKSARPVIQRHLDRALDLQTKLGGGPVS